MLFPRDFWRFASMCLFVFIWAGMSTKDLSFALWIGLCSYLIASSKAESAWYKLTTESCNVMTVCTYVFMLNTNLRHINEHQTLIETVRDTHAINGCFYYFYWTQCLKQEILITFFDYMYLFKGDFHKNMSVEFCPTKPKFRYINFLMHFEKKNVPLCALITVTHLVVFTLTWCFSLYFGFWNIP